MTTVVTLHINSDDFQVTLESGGSHSVKEDDTLSLTIATNNAEEPPLIYIEDTEMQFEQSVSENEFTIYKTPKNRYFSECFGQAFVRIYVAAEAYTVLFNVRAKKASAEQATKMVSYLGRRHESLIKSCFSRSTTPVGAMDEGFSDPESIVSEAEHFINTLLTLRSELIATRRERLTPTRQPIWKSNRTTCDIDPADILSNLDAISPTSPIGDLELGGRHFAIMDLDVSTLLATSDVFENRVLLGGLYSIRIKTQLLLDNLDQSELSKSSSDGYESLDRLLLKVTSAGMVIRCNSLMEKTAELVKFFETRMGVRYNGDIRPVMTPYARTSKVYRILYTHLANWYSLGAPSFGTQKFLIKLKSLSKIYELYSLFHIIEYLTASGWEGHDTKPHPTLGEHIPSEICLLKRELRATVSYEPIIHPDNGNLLDKHLVDVVHRRPGFKYSFWNPDFVIRIDSKNQKTKYIILDAKYSTESVVRDIHTPAIIEKYYWGISSYDMESNALSNNAISGVVALYPQGGSSPFIPYGRRCSIGSQRIPLPIIGAIRLAIDQPKQFASVMNTIFKEVENSLSQNSAQNFRVSTGGQQRIHAEHN